MKLFNEKTILKSVDKCKPLKVGYLYKRGEKYNNEYKKRYFILMPSNLLYYYHHQGDKEPIGVIFLDGHIVELVDEATFGSKALILKFPSADENCRSYTLAADTSHEIEEWMLAITRVGIDYLMVTLDDLEEQLEAVTFVGTLDKTSRDSAASVSKFRCQSDVQRSNPFNNATIPNESTDKLQQRLVDTNQQKLLGMLCSDFDALHFKVKDYWLEYEDLSELINSSESPQRDLISIDDPPTEDLISF